MRLISIVLVVGLGAVSCYLPVDPDHSRVVGGVPASADKAPWQISMTRTTKSGDSHMCGGSLIGPKTVLTAAHCCDGQTVAPLKVKYGGLDRNKLANSTPITQIIIHPDWNSDNIDYDFCILQLQNPVQESKNVKIISIANSSPVTGTLAHLTGWGKSWGISPFLPTQLQYTTMKILSAVECNVKWNDTNPITPRMICAQSRFGSGCNGDSGGPLVADSKLVGVVSWGAAYCPADTTVRPAVYSDPVVVKRWVEENIQ